MRWLTIPPDDAAGQAAKSAKLRSMEEFWGWFSGKAESLRHPDAQLIEELRSVVGRVDPRLMFEISGSERTGTMEFVLTPEADHFLRPMVSEMVRTAPNLPGWRFAEYRSPVEAGLIEDAVQARLGHGFHAKGLDLNMDRGRVNLVYHCGGIGGASESMYEEALVSTEVLLGEENLDVWVGSIDAKASIMPRPKVGLHQLPSEFGRMKEQLMFRTPPQPRWQVPFDQRPIGMVDLRSAAVDSPGVDTGFDDALVFSAEPVFLENRLTFKTFHSTPVSRFGEVFLYLQFERPAAWGGREAEARGVLEEQIDRNIAPGGLGAVVGGCHGIRLSSVQVAAVQLWPCVDAVRAVAQSAGLGLRSWVLFHDATMGSEWVGVWPESPTPGGLAG